MLRASKSSTLRGESCIGDKIAVNFTAEISSNQSGNSNTRAVILDQELYAANRSECRKDQAEFQEKVYLVEDKFIEESFTFENKDEEELAK